MCIFYYLSYENYDCAFCGREAHFGCEEHDRYICEDCKDQCRITPKKEEVIKVEKTPEEVRQSRREARATKDEVIPITSGTHEGRDTWEGDVLRRDYRRYIKEPENNNNSSDGGDKKDGELE